MTLKFSDSKNSLQFRTSNSNCLKFEEQEFEKQEKEASSLLSQFAIRKLEIEQLLKTANLSMDDKQDLKLELKMIKETLKNSK